MRKRGHLGKPFYFIVQLEIIVTGLGTKNGTTTFIQGVPDITLTCTTGTLLTMQLFARTLYFKTGLYFAGTLSLRCEVLLYRQIDHVVIRFNTKYFVRQFDGAARF